MHQHNANHPGYKQTKLGWIPEDWEVAKFGDKFNFLETYSISRENLTYETTQNEIKNIHYGDIHATFKKPILDIHDKNNLDLIPYIKEYGVNYNNLTYLIDGDLIIADVSEDYEGLATCIELINIKNKKITSGLHTFAVRDINKNFANGYKTYILKNSSISKEIKKIATGISVYGISKSNLQKLLILLPPLPEQKKIAEILSSWDKTINLTKKLITSKEKQKKALMQNLLTGKIRFKKFKDEKRNVYHLKDFLIPAIREKKKPYKPFLAIGIRSHGKGTFQKTNFDPLKIDLEVLYEVKENDLITNITFAWEGAIAIVKKEDEGGLVSHRFPTYTFNNKLCVVDYFRYVIIQKRFRFLLDLISPGGAGRNRVLSKKDFLKLKWILPSVPEQTKIAEVLTICDEEIDLLKRKLEKLKEQKKGLMQKLLTGEVRVKV